MLICDVGPRDGLQNDPTILDPAMRAELVRRLAGTGLQRIEVTSFVNPGRVPAMAGAEEVAALTDGLECERAGLVLNERGFERFLETSLPRVCIGASVSETFSVRNQNSSVHDAVAAACRIRDAALDRGIAVTAHVMVAFGCPFEGAVDPDRAVEVAAELAGGRNIDVMLCDTIGIASPRQVRRLAGSAAQVGGRIGVHLHNTRNTGYANAYAALEAGVELFDASVGGTGGCPFAPGATGNIATEDLVGMLERDGVDTGVDLDALIAVAVWLEGALGHRVDGQLHRLSHAAG